MKKYFGLIVLLIIAFCLSSNLNKTNAYEEVNYKYRIVSNSNSIDDLLELYETKEVFVISFNNALENDLVIEDIYKTFCLENITLEDNTFVIIIGDGNGISLEGSLKTSVCDSSTINNRYALLEWLSNIK